MAQLSTEGIEQLRLYYSNYLPSFFYAMIAPMILFVLFMFIEVNVAVTYLICVPLIPISIVMVSKWAKKIFNKYWDQYTSLGDSFLDNTSGMKELKIFAYDEAKQKQMAEESEEFRKITMKVLTMQLASITIMDLVAFGGAGIGIVLSLIAMRNGLDIYQALFIILIGAEFFLPMRALGSAFHVAMNGATAGKKVIRLLSTEDYKDGNNKIEKINVIELDNVSFKYERNNVLNNVSLRLDKGFNSIVGLSGSGKSTIAKLCSKIEKTTSGFIMIDENDINNINSSQFYHKACYISNNTYIFHQTIRESFKFYNEDITEEEMINLLASVKLNHFSLDLKINDQNSNISGGEKQRLALAFYLSKNYEFYIFDEATSNIDIDSEEIILEKINEIAKNKIVLFISHRLKSVRNSNNIYFLEDGRIIENGSFKELINKNSKFKELYNFQNSLEEGM
jgi:ATP-binding cassette subfamily C protein